MNDKKLLIVGIDPGITTAYAVLDISGKFLSAYSSKNLDLNKIISDIIKIGKVLIVGTDKSKVPGLVSDFAIKIGAKVVSPNEDLLVDDKKRIVSGIKTGDIHQSDALASALFAFKEVKQLLDKIDSIVDETKKINLRNKIKELVLIKKLSIRQAITILESKDEEDKIIEEVISERKLDEESFLAIYNKLKRVEKDNQLLRSYNQNLSNRIGRIDSNAKVAKTNDKDIMDLKKASSLKESRIKFLEHALLQKNKDIDRLKSAIKKLNLKMSSVDDYYVLKKLDNLGIKGFEVKNKTLGIKKNDILLVDDPNIISESLVQDLKDKIFVVINKKPLGKKIAETLPFVFIEANLLEIEEDKFFGFANKRKFDMIKDKKSWAEKIISDYKKERSVFRQI